MPAELPQQADRIAELHPVVTHHLVQVVEQVAGFDRRTVAPPSTALPGETFATARAITSAAASYRCRRRPRRSTTAAARSGRRSRPSPCLPIAGQGSATGCADGGFWSVRCPARGGHCCIPGQTYEPGDVRPSVDERRPWAGNSGAHVKWRTVNRPLIERVSLVARKHQCAERRVAGVLWRLFMMGGVVDVRSTCSFAAAHGRAAR